MSIKDTALSDAFERIKTAVGKMGKTGWIVLIGAFGMLLIGASALFSGQETQEQAVSATYDTQAYVEALESRLEEMVSSIAGAGQARVMVTLENGVEYVYASEEKTNSDHTQSDGGSVSVSDDNQRTVVTVDAADGKEGLLITEIQPTVRGVVVACEGAGNEAIAATVATAVRTALDITDKRVCVIPYISEGV